MWKRYVYNDFSAQGLRLIKKITIEIDKVMKEKVNLFPSPESLNGHTKRQLSLCH
jgi:hypothetical protein